MEGGISDSDRRGPKTGAQGDRWCCFCCERSYPYALVVLLMFAYTRLDGVLLERLLPGGKTHAEVYAGAYRLLDACNMLGFMFASLLLRVFARLVKDPPHTGVRSLASLSFS
ncbi:MAG: hypothetical protein IPK76_19270 [Lewinellaceae bacterium]|nr:hypothetical protein [Lewinellaceae bacterium]